MRFRSDTPEMQEFFGRAFSGGRREAVFANPHVLDLRPLASLKEAAGLPIRASRPRSADLETRIGRDEVILSISTEPTPTGEQIVVRSYPMR